MSFGSVCGRETATDPPSVRTLLQHPANRQCADCGQRSVTYANMTVGSFVCTACSGLLRGLNPPHRVKSISMAVFTSEDIESLQQRGNNWCRSVWMGLYDSQSNNSTNHTSHSDQSIKNFMSQKYEKKLYYIEPQKVATNNSKSQLVNSNDAMGSHNILPLNGFGSQHCPIIDSQGSQLISPTNIVGSQCGSSIDAVSTRSDCSISSLRSHDSGISSLGSTSSLPAPPSASAAANDIPLLPNLHNNTANNFEIASAEFDRLTNSSKSAVDYFDQSWDVAAVGSANGAHMKANTCIDQSQPLDMWHVPSISASPVTANDNTNKQSQCFPVLTPNSAVRAANTAAGDDVDKYAALKQLDELYRQNSVTEQCNDHHFFAPLDGTSTQSFNPFKINDDVPNQWSPQSQGNNAWGTFGATTAHANNQSYDNGFGRSIQPDHMTFQSANFPNMAQRNKSNNPFWS